MGNPPPLPTTTVESLKIEIEILFIYRTTEIPTYESKTELDIVAP